jgi:hypothetical protein
MKNIGLRIAATLHIAGLALHTGYRRRIEMLQDNKERGSLTAEQIFWTVAILLVAGTTIAIVVGVINAKAAEIPKG